MQRVLRAALVAAGLGSAFAAVAQSVEWDVAPRRVTQPATQPGEGNPAGMSRFFAIDPTGSDFFQVGRVVGDRNAVFVARYGADGTLRYWRSIDQFANARVGGIAAGPSGDAYVALTARRNGSGDAVLLRLDAQGATTWTRYADYANDRVHAVLPAGDGGAYLVVDVPSAVSPSVQVRRYTPTGSVAWERTLAGGGGATAALAPASDGVLVAVNALTGNFVQRYAGDGTPVYTATMTAPVSELAEGADGTLYAGTIAAELVAFDAVGAPTSLPIDTTPANVFGSAITDIDAPTADKVFVALAGQDASGRRNVVARVARGANSLAVDWLETPGSSVVASGPLQPRVRGLASGGALVALDEGTFDDRRVRLAAVSDGGTTVQLSLPIGGGPGTRLFGLARPGALERAVVQLYDADRPGSALLAQFNGFLQLEWTTPTPAREVGFEAIDERPLRLAPDGSPVLVATFANDGVPATAVERYDATGARRFARDFTSYASLSPADFRFTATGQLDVLMTRNVPGLAEAGSVFARLDPADGSVLRSRYATYGATFVQAVGLAPDATGGSLSLVRSLTTGGQYDLQLDAEPQAGPSFTRAVEPLASNDLPRNTREISGGEFLSLVARPGASSRIDRRDGTGAVLWSRTLPGVNVFDYDADATSVYYVGVVYTTGWTITGRLDRATGAIEWQLQAQDGERLPRALSIVDGDLFVAGTWSRTIDPPLAGMVERRRASDGAVVAEYVTDDPAAIFTAIDRDAAGNLYAAGASALDLQDPDSDVLVVKLAPSLSRRWDLRHRPVDGTAEAISVKVASDGSVYVAAVGDRRGEASGVRLLRIEQPPLGDPIFADQFE